MEELNDSAWDVVISGTGLYQSFLALALSRSGKKVLHLDKNDFYGGLDAAFSLQEAEEWVEKVQKDPSFGPFESASIVRSPGASKTDGGLSFSRAYTLSLSPQPIYSQSRLISTLVSSKVYRQLEFQAVGSWWIHRDVDGSENGSSSGAAALQRVPSSREDVFADEVLSMKSKRSLMKFLRYLQTEEESPTNEEEMQESFPSFLQSKLQIAPELYDPLASLSLTPKPLDSTTASYALSRIKRHLQSLGVFGPGFASMLMKWGGGAELAQIACRACAVGGGVYVLNRGIQTVAFPDEGNIDDGLRIELSNGESVRSSFLVGSAWDLPTGCVEPENQTGYARATRCVMIVSSPLETLFPVTSEGGPVSAGTVVIFPGQAVSKGDDVDSPPVYLVIHSSDTGECPAGQSVIYGSTLCPGEDGFAALESAARRLIGSVDADAQILWTLRYTQLGPLETDGSSVTGRGGVFSFPAPGLDLSFDDGMLDRVKEVWKAVMGDGVDEDGYLMFAARESVVEDDDE